MNEPSSSTRVCTLTTHCDRECRATWCIINALKDEKEVL